MIPGYLKMPDYQDAFGTLIPFSLESKKFLGIVGEVFLEMASDKKGVSGNSRSKIFWESTASPFVFNGLLILKRQEFEKIWI